MDNATVLRSIKAEDARARIEAGQAVLIDIREADEFARERVAGARSAPLSTFDRFDAALASGRPVIVTCRSGARTAMNAQRLLAKGFADVAVLDGGLEAWKRAGLPVQVDRRVPIDLMRQVQIVVGAMVLGGTLLALLVSPWFAIVPAFAGAGLLVAGTTGFCGMARMLRHAPWNRGLLAPRQ
jgi:rhodanese-related sulfurtransferase